MKTTTINKMMIHLAGFLLEEILREEAKASREKEETSNRIRSRAEHVISRLSAGLTIEEALS